MTPIEFWIVTVEDEDRNLHGSEIIWGDGMNADDAIDQFRKQCGGLPGDYYPPDCDLFAHGPYLTNDAGRAAL